MNNPYFWLFLIVPLLLAPFGFSPWVRYNLLPAPYILEGAFILGSLLLLPKGVTPKRLFLGITCVAYIIGSLSLMMIYARPPLGAVLHSYKFILYLVLLSLFVNRRLFSDEMVRLIFLSLLAIVFVNYTIWRLAGLDARPGVFTENNFELLLLIILFYLHARLLNNVPWLIVILMSVVVVLSGSRVTMAAFLCVWCVLFLTRCYRWRDRAYMGLVGGVLLGLVFIVFAQRVPEGGVAAIDRVLFLRVFLQEMGSWNMGQVLFGTFPLTPLEPESCRMLAYYLPAFGYLDGEPCYSPVLHSLALRVIYDHGLVVFLGTWWILWWFLGSAGFSRGDRMALIGVLFLNAVSVSSLNSVFAAIGLSIALASGGGRSRARVNRRLARVREHGE